MTKIELIRTILPISPTTAKINITVKVGESYRLIDSVVIINAERIKTNAMRHEMDLVFE
jgi:hypothetical protein